MSDMQKVAGRCPAGCGETLFLADGGHIVCSFVGCSSPCAVDELLADPHSHEHIVTFDDNGFAIQHPLIERGADLVECGLHQHIRLLDGPPVRPGKYFARHDGQQWAWSPMS
jgi:hypothetical protein